MKKILSVILIFTTICAILVGCQPINKQNTTESIPDNKTDYSAYILDQAYASNKENTMFSPLSLDMAIALVAEGVSEEYKELFNEFLGRDDYAEFAKQYAERLKDLNQESTHEYNKYKTVFEIANSLWYDKTCALKPEYEQKLLSYTPELSEVDFKQAAQTVKLINDWCKKATHDMIPSIISEENIHNNTMLIAINAIYFESPWANKWYIPKEQSVFKGFNTETKINFMANESTIYYENDKATAFGLAYKNGLIFIGILPTEKGDFNLQDLDIDSLLASKTTRYDVKMTMPKFKFDNKITNLKTYLTQLGFGDMFKDGVLSNITNGNSLTIDKIIQADAIELDEDGTRAAAVTGLISDNAVSKDPRQVKKINLNRPFAFLIYDEEMKQIVFMGKVVEVE